MIYLFSISNEKWPPEEHTKRLGNYQHFRKLFFGEHQEVFPRIDNWLTKEMDKSIIYIVCNYAGLISKVSADLLFGESIQVGVGDPGSQQQVAMNSIIDDNALHIKNYEMALSTSWRGDTVLKARFGKQRAWQDSQQVVIETVPAHCFFPHINSDSVQEMTGATLAWVKKNPQDKKRYLRKEIHEPGLIRNELWLLDGEAVRKQVRLSVFPEYAGLEEEQETGYPGLLVEHIPNWRLDDMLWGISDYYDLESLFDALNNRVSRIDTILDKHSDPKLILPPGSMDYDERLGRYYIEKEAIQCMEIDGDADAAHLPRYLVWDAQLEAAFRQIDKLVEMLMLMSEVSPAAFGMDKNGAVESGRALKFKMFRTIAKIHRKRLYFDQALRNILYTAQVLDVTHGRGSYTPITPHLEWQDGLPNDLKEAAEIESLRMSATLTSRESAIRRLDKLEGQNLQEELDKIQEDQGGVLSEDDISAKLRKPPAEDGDE